LFFIFRKKVKFIYSAFIFLIIFSNGLFADILWRLLEHPWKRLDYSLVAPSYGIVVLSSSRHIPLIWILGCQNVFQNFKRYEL